MVHILSGFHQKPSVYKQGINLLHKIERYMSMWPDFRRALGRPVLQMN